MAEADLLHESIRSNRARNSHRESNGLSDSIKLFSLSHKEPSSHQQANPEARKLNSAIEDGTIQANPRALQRQERDLAMGSERVLDNQRPAMRDRTVSSQSLCTADALAPENNNTSLGATSHSRAKSDGFQSSNPQNLPKVFTSDYSNPMFPDVDHVIEKDYPVESLEPPPLQYHHTWDEDPETENEEARKTDQQSHARNASNGSDSHTVSSGSSSKNDQKSHEETLSRPASAYTLGFGVHKRGRSLTPQNARSEASLSPSGYRRNVSGQSRSPDSRNSSYIDLLNMPYSQQMDHQHTLADRSNLRSIVGKNASLLEARKTLEMYRANVKKTNDLAAQYEFAIFMINVAQEAGSNEVVGANGFAASSKDRGELLQEARQILQKLSDRGYPFAQYYLGDGYASGLFNRGKTDAEKAFHLFVSAGKHGHAESAYRAALCYEFGWGCRRDYAKAVQFYRQAASKNHPGAALRLGTACLAEEMGLVGKDREGVKWLKRATDAADYQHNAGPYELGVLHINGFGADVFKDVGYAAQLLTQAAELGHPEANLRMGEVYEHGLLTCPKDPALSIHFYNGAAQAGLPKAMMALCAWYMVGAEPVLEKDEIEAYEWARKAAEMSYARAEYAVGYFTEMGLGCRRDPLEANVWYIRAADHGEDRAKQRLAIIRTAETGETKVLESKASSKNSKVEKGSHRANKEEKNEKDCIVM